MFMQIWFPSFVVGEIGSPDLNLSYHFGDELSALLKGLLYQPTSVLTTLVGFCGRCYGGRKSQQQGFENLEESLRPVICFRNRRLMPSRVFILLFFFIVSQKYHKTTQTKKVDQGTRLTKTVKGESMKIWNHSRTELSWTLRLFEVMATQPSPIFCKFFSYDVMSKSLISTIKQQLAHSDEKVPYGPISHEPQITVIMSLKLIICDSTFG